MLHRVIMFAVLCFSAVSALGAVPQSMSLQGYLTDRIGSPIEASQTVTFAIYTVPIGGVPVWQETQSVAFSNGLFSVTLGTVAAFPPDLFDVPLWLGTTIGTDNEMEPRRALTTAGFSFRAEDSNALQGRSAAELDQAGHVDDLANPHDVTIGQIGAASTGELAAHAGNAANPHLVTATQTGATDLAVFASHTADQAGHHVRYADAEAVTAMGAQTASNPLNHDRYTDAESFSAVLAADGEGSGLDADAIDGLQAEQIIDAASNAAGGARFQFVGFSTDTVAADVGLLGMTDACKSTFGTEAKFATSKEILHSTSFTAQSGTAWLQPVIIEASYSSGVRVIFDISGEYMETAGGVTLTCEGWSNDNIFGALIVDGSIRLNVSTCTTPRHVACSIPEIP